MKALTLAFQDDPRFAELKKHRDESGGIHPCMGDGSPDHPTFDGGTVRHETVSSDRDL